MMRAPSWVSGHQRKQASLRPCTRTNCGRAPEGPPPQSISRRSVRRRAEDPAERSPDGRLPECVRGVVPAIERHRRDAEFGGDRPHRDAIDARTTCNLGASTSNPHRVGFPLSRPYRHPITPHNFWKNPKTMQLYSFGVPPKTQTTTPVRRSTGPRGGRPERSPTFSPWAHWTAKSQ